MAQFLLLLECKMQHGRTKLGKVMAGKVETKTGLIVPEVVQRRAGINAGDRIEFKVSPRTITIKAAPARTYTPTKAEASAIRKGRSAIKRGEFVTLDELINDLDNPHRKAGAKGASKSSR